MFRTELQAPKRVKASAAAAEDVSKEQTQGNTRKVYKTAMGAEKAEPKFMARSPRIPCTALPVWRAARRKHGRGKGTTRLVCRR